MRARISLQSVVFDSAIHIQYMPYMLKMNLLAIDSVAMILYNIIREVL